MWFYSIDLKIFGWTNSFVIQHINLFSFYSSDCISATFVCVSNWNILNIQNNVYVEGIYDSTTTSVIEEFVDVFDDSFSRTTNLWNPKVADPKLKPYSGKRFKDIKSCFQLYIQYGLQGGFNVRKSTQKVKNKIIVTKYIVCSHGGSHETSMSKLKKHSDDAMSESSHTSSAVGDQVRRRNTITKKCECNAKVILKSLGSLGLNGYVVSCFIEGHNHPLASESGKEFFRANRSMTALLLFYRCWTDSQKIVNRLTLYCLNIILSRYNLIFPN
ncbi:hypothetical protein POM88_002492 [Heracleum sosnowskyi]|uniref:FAR1 domain-containing protein n=1 Tax=Heracleum sosnowskyi TaxID=360622 RepID=A0AAD8NBC4_9APIA|nr:hypothetical protein POM88_002492 [Heracleum sosnowskyi]